MIHTAETNHRRALNAARRVHGSPLGALPAYVNHGRWIVACPEDGCVGAELASETRPFVCISCAAGPYTIVWPPDRAGIEAALEGRPVENQNWEPGETIEALLAENVEHGIG